MAPSIKGKTETSSLLWGAAPPELTRDIPDECFECGCKNIIEVWSEGNVVCTGCGLVQREHLFDLGEEHRTFADDDGPDKSRSGPASNPLLESEPLTGVGAGSSSSGRAGVGSRSVPGVGSRERGGGGGGSGGVSRIALAIKKVSGHDRAILAAGSRIDELCERLSAPRTVSTSAKEIHALFYSKKKNIRNLEAVLAACIVLGFRHVNSRREFKEVAAVCRAGINKVKIGAALRQIQKVCPEVKVATLNTKVDDSTMMRYCQRLGLPRISYNPAGKLAQALCEKGCTNRSPSTICGVALYIIAKQSAPDLRKFNDLPKEVADLLGISPTTILEAYGDAMPFFHEILPTGAGLRKLESFQ